MQRCELERNDIHFMNPLCFSYNERLFNNHYSLQYYKNIFILEGPDGCGKSTIAKAIQSVTGYPIYHLTYFSDPEKMQAQYDYIENYLKNWLFDNGDGDGIILDRFLLSNKVYQTVFQNGPIVKNYDNLYKLIEEQTYANVTYINCLPDDKERYLEHFKKIKEEREELYTDIDKMSQVYDLYKEGFEDEFGYCNFQSGDIQIHSINFDLFLQIDTDKETDYSCLDIDMKDIIK